MTGVQTCALPILQRNDEIALDEVVRSAVDRLLPFAAQANVALNVQSNKQATLTSRGNLARLTQVVVNLLHNAIKFSSPGDAVLVQVLAPTVDQPEAKIVITDRGTGIAREDVDRVFERFFIADRARSKGGGTGLGLSIARHIVEAHDGEISVTSTLGEGSTFTIAFPSR